MKIPFGDLKRQYDQLRTEIDAAISEVCDSGWVILGNQVHSFEKNFAYYCNAKYGVAVGSGTEALHLALVASGVEYGDEVITVANTCVPTLSAISFAGAIPVFVDIDETTYTINPSLIAERITSKTKAIVPVHLYGQCADMTPILEISHQYNLAVIEDCAQSHGSLYKNQMAGTMGDAGCFSFYPSKNLGAFGDGGLVLTNNQEIAEKLTKLRNYGQEKRYYHSIKGFNSRLDELQAAILNTKLPYLNAWNQRRREIAQRYHQAFSAVGIICPFEDSERFHVYHLYVIRVPQRDRFQQLLQEQGIATIIHYPVPVHLQESYSEFQGQSKFLPVTEKLASEIVSLPLYPELTDEEEEIDYIIKGVLEVYEQIKYSEKSFPRNSSTITMERNKTN
ncbi:DegT/DnrJ/EryC1/StrS family aminotransferase [Dolichospermum flos-aquae]|uniref:DegT/DnrJ/EryC1/StrS family aminotransferase n=1 Tax=Dolichospermum flos-aquae UHCC 0037 TaxID=2590026 RepID=A0ACC7S985_DOLFA|nr:DegT/DnrJ/EryC1/StrS family aminotransferase [Dolichospermum flos-aquae]MTJ44742.1 DegT/DnrJ/EryC1/StrS family aminotransferase [Dolichospermum flos-aquae UHCC 0037]